MPPLQGTKAHAYLSHLQSALIQLILNLVETNKVRHTVLYRMRETIQSPSSITQPATDFICQADAQMCINCMSA